MKEDALSAPSGRLLAAYVVPFALFMAGLALSQAVGVLGEKSDSFFLREPMYWVFPLQTVLCGGALIFFRRSYDFGSWRPVPGAVAAGLVVFALWISPQWLFGQAARTDGFNPEVFAASPGLHAWTVIGRFLRLVVVVPLVEEIFWRGFLQRYLIDERFTAVPFGKYSPLSFWAVAVAFTGVHAQADWPAAFVTAVIYGGIAVRTRSLRACMAAHATTNLALGGYIMLTRQWGFW